METVYLSIGSNIGHRARFIHAALERLKQHCDVELESTSFLYESLPLYVIDQPAFLNCACRIKTSLSPIKLLEFIKYVEKDMGRTETIRYGPRVIDIDILVFGSAPVNIPASMFPAIDSTFSLGLNIPHLRLHEREFVLKPLLDIDPNLQVCYTNQWVRVSDLLDAHYKSVSSELRQVIPLGLGINKGERMIFTDDSMICGIINATPDSFSDGHKCLSDASTLLSNLRRRADALVSEGADMIDIGGESTRPGAKPVSVEEELRRVIPLIRSVRESHPSLCISVDTRQHIVAQEAIQAGADIINDVSAGRYDVNMIPTAVSLNVPMIFMHSRGVPSDMMSATNTTYANVVQDVADELSFMLSRASGAGMPKWLQLIDPGIGFSKLTNDNLRLLNPYNISQLRKALSSRPIMIGASRKRFIQEIYDEANCNTSSTRSPLDREFGTAAASCSAALANACMIRVHDVKATKQALSVFRAILKAR